MEESAEEGKPSRGGPFRKVDEMGGCLLLRRIPATVRRKLSSPTRASNRFQEKAIPVLVPQHALASSSGRFCFSSFYSSPSPILFLFLSLLCSRVSLFPVSSRFTSPRATGLSAPIKPRSLTPSTSRLITDGIVVSR